MNQQNNKRLRVVTIVSTDPSDVFFANQIRLSHNVVGVVVENMTPARDRSSFLRKLARNIRRPNELVRKAWEITYGRLHARGGSYAAADNAADFTICERADDNAVEWMRLNYGVSPNNQDCVEWISSLQPDLIITCGGSLLGSNILAVPTHGALNLHGGLSQYYRGIRTTDWAILNREPEKIGCTVHFISSGIDDGAIVWQGRPVIEVGDNPNGVYVKVVKLGIEMMRSALDDLAAGQLQSMRPGRLGDLYLKREFSSATLRQVWRLYDRGLIDRYAMRSNSGENEEKIELLRDFDLHDRRIAE